MSILSRPSRDVYKRQGILLTPNTTQGWQYAAIMATGSHGVRFQYNYTHDQAGQPGVVSAGTPRWLRLTRTGDTITGYESTNGTIWRQIGIAHLAGLPQMCIRDRAHHETGQPGCDHAC